jgi:hypothetical protein
MTVCIAAICEFGRAVITASDYKISLGSVSGDVAVKQIRGILPGWSVMYAGNDIAHIGKVLDTCANGADTNTPLSIDKAQDAFVAAYQSVFSRVCSDTYLSPYQLNFDTFKKNGKKIFHSTPLSYLQNAIATFDLGCTLLISGFDAHKRAHLFTVENPGVSRSFDEVGFWSIGTGQAQANSSLMFHDYNIGNDRDLASYLVYVAKLMSESADGVGTLLSKLAEIQNRNPHKYWLKLL